jgi:hypothetical protein
VVSWFDVTTDPAYVVELVRRLLGVESAEGAGALSIAA